MSKPVTHLQKLSERWGGTVNGTLCARMSGADDRDSTNNPSKVTCKLCTREMARQEMRRQNEAKYPAPNEMRKP
jgi:hypothetical protein